MRDRTSARFARALMKVSALEESFAVDVDPDMLSGVQEDLEALGCTVTREAYKDRLTVVPPWAKPLEIKLQKQA